MALVLSDWQGDKIVYRKFKNGLTKAKQSVKQMINIELGECKDAPYHSYTPYIALGSRRGISSVIGGLVQCGALDFFPERLFIQSRSPLQPNISCEM